MSQFEESLRDLIRKKLQKENKYVSVEEIEKLVDWKMDSIAKKIFEEFYE